MFILSHQSALEFVRLKRNREISPICLTRIQNPDSRISRLIKTPTYKLLQNPVHIMVAKNHNRNNTSTVKLHTINNINNLKLFESYGDWFSVPVAPLLLCQLANSLPIEKLLLLILEFCGTYSFSNIEHSTKYQIPARTTVDDIQHFENWRKTNHFQIAGSSKLCSAIKFAQNGSASPIESMIFSMLTLSKKFGGFGLKNCTLNHEIKLSADGQNLTGKNKVYGDICLIDTNTIIEYDSHKFHSEAKKFDSDKMRHDCLALENWSVYTITSQEVMNYEIFITKIRKILRSVKIYENRIPHNYPYLQKRLYQQLMSYV